MDEEGWLHSELSYTRAWIRAWQGCNLAANSLNHHVVKELSIHQSIPLKLHRQGTKATLKQAQRVSSHSKRQTAKVHSIEEKRRSTPSTPSAHTVTLITPTALPRKTTIPIRELGVAEVISPNGISIRRRIDTVSSPGRANVWTVDLGT